MARSHKKLTHVPRADEEQEVDDLRYHHNDEELVDFIIDTRFDFEAVNAGVVIARTTEVMG